MTQSVFGPKPVVKNSLEKAISQKQMKDIHQEEKHDNDIFGKQIKEQYKKEIVNETQPIFEETSLKQRNKRKKCVNGDKKTNPKRQRSEKIHSNHSSEKYSNKRLTRINLPKSCLLGLHLADANSRSSRSRRNRSKNKLNTAIEKNKPTIRRINNVRSKKGENSTHHQIQMTPEEKVSVNNVERHELDYDVAELESMKYREIQKICKKYGIKANQKRVKLLSALCELANKF